MNTKRQVRIFENKDKEALEREINQFMSDPAIEVVDIKMNTSPIGPGRGSAENIWIMVRTILIYYEGNLTQAQSSGGHRPIG